MWLNSWTIVGFLTQESKTWWGSGIIQKATYGSPKKPALTDLIVARGWIIEMFACQVRSFHQLSELRDKGNCSLPTHLRTPRLFKLKTNFSYWVNTCVICSDAEIWRERQEYKNIIYAKRRVSQIQSSGCFSEEHRFNAAQERETTRFCTYLWSKTAPRTKTASNSGKWTLIAYHCRK